MIVGHYLGCGWDVERILTHLEQHPHGISERYLREGRLAREIARSARKYSAAALPLSDNAGWAIGWQARTPQPETRSNLRWSFSPFASPQIRQPAPLGVRPRSRNSWAQMSMPPSSSRQ
jgi:hypothetical protein